MTIPGEGRQEHDKSTTIGRSEQRPRSARPLLARRELSLRRADLPARQSAAARAVTARAHQAAFARPLGHDARVELHLRPSQPRHPRAGPERDLCLRSRPRRPRHGRQHLSRRQLQRDLSRYRARCRRIAQAVQTVLLPRRHPESRGAGNARLDPRRRRARLRAGACLWRGLRQSRPDRRLCRRRRRGRDRPARRVLALQQVPQSRP
ncbi:hypothetical protein ACVWWO_007216 [Bradyrhizobium sp. F1.13.1]